MAHYSSAAYWEARYASITTTFDWYVRYSPPQQQQRPAGLRASHPAASSSSVEGRPSSGASVSTTAAASDAASTKSHHHHQQQQQQHTSLGSSGAAPTTVAPSASSPSSSSSPLRDHILAAVPKKARVLFIGCGTSTMPEEMYDDGFRNIVACDRSAKAISYMEQRRLGTLPDPEDAVAAAAALPAAAAASVVAGSPRGTGRQAQPIRNICYVEADAAAMPQFADSSFDAVVDKAMIDAAFCGADAETQQAHVAAIVAEVYRVLRPGGQFVHISHTGATDGVRSVVFEPKVSGAAAATTSWVSAALVKLKKDAALDILSAVEGVEPCHFLYFLKKDQ